MDILNKIKKAGLVGRSGSCFPVALKWEMVAKASDQKKYVICNASEGEPGVKKDGYILNNFPVKVIDGIKIALNFLKADKGFIYLNPEYYKKYHKKLKKIINTSPIELIAKPANAGYIGGEESSILNSIEAKRIEPRLRPPFPTTNGLWGYPTLINNVETFYDVSLAAASKYKNTRFYTINGDCLLDGVYELPTNYTIEKILKLTKNFPNFPFFVQIGGDASGLILNSRQLKRPVSGAGSITIYSQQKYNPKELIANWLYFFKSESCGQCTPCREGTYRLMEILNSKEINWKNFTDILDNLSDTSFCGLGCAAPLPIKSYITNVLSGMPENKINLGPGAKKIICGCFK
ncbi:hypothetical protein CO115_01040 [Candidatus Falkowbacteria bacterium CG_4_9_14_3_um_filter_36_9]|uniref:NADH-ubiquinone oxidoreductase 51kDa subunit iron-sulphur binding domain-containing protein n=2 Tax=Candidatus Falkowiibacteriota TaxID=1752728 RepID=A0A1J4TA70_9BACT|nr:MAG: hypothetical protein AUJ27_00795 [Candidatus Falkowbacteria bacterium CG1_02_37_44]PIV51763.1 MAG: hypothetical protein COS18_02015 [Candidatus Falkowbacteria bacterium CG02_land_8_20_14_3_00_36_14]PIX10851.1 MAG: hypothetical protein COZ73_04405 [Candidatus Falkowbacteria bacterium CG_4_8_14_3_um_filter_36_11]PJA11196.1 MAG: hypothetical protein COX67_01035 [Candidatus Falkowbacteria bacterium CG_4_10_14_0_2_um_filter_36_22]PJB20540.1 MAG: hypothetical protein CO115_01040 [Candidatus F